MILGIGTDITSMERIEQTIKEQGDRFIDRCFTAAEKETVERRAEKDPAARAAGYAKRWAAKEAAAKALGLGIREGIFLKDIEVTNDSNGKPILTFYGGAKERLTHITPEGMTVSTDISLGDDPPMAVAFVVISAV